jgi:hypothetical protein
MNLTLQHNVRKQNLAMELYFLRSMCATAPQKLHLCPRGDAIMETNVRFGERELSILMMVEKEPDNESQKGLMAQLESTKNE